VSECTVGTRVGATVGKGGGERGVKRGAIVRRCVGNDGVQESSVLHVDGGRWAFEDLEVIVRPPSVTDRTTNMKN
jgi:hypothetical protein